MTRYSFAEPVKLTGMVVEVTVPKTKAVGLLGATQAAGATEVSEILSSPPGGCVPRLPSFVHSKTTLVVPAYDVGMVMLAVAQVARAL